MNAPYRPVRVRPRTGEQSNGHQTYFIGVPWQVAEGIDPEQLFQPAVDEDTGVLTFTPTSESDPLVRVGPLERERLDRYIREAIAVEAWPTVEGIVDTLRGER